MNRDMVDRLFELLRLSNEAERRKVREFLHADIWPEIKGSAEPEKIIVVEHTGEDSEVKIDWFQVQGRVT